jgi:predicted SnoaL-like aldol condensation-catalyzing enzyme
VSQTIAKKLGLQPGMRALVIAAPAGYRKLLEPLPVGVAISEATGGAHEFVQFFATRKSELKKRAAALLKHAARGGLVWIAYPKKTSGIESDLDRDSVRDAMSAFGWRAVTILAIDETWAALRFRPVGDVRSRGRE